MCSVIIVHFIEPLTRPDSLPSSCIVAMLKLAFDEEYVTGEGLSSESDEFGYQEALMENDFDPEWEEDLEFPDESIAVPPPSKKLKQTKKRKENSSTGKRKSQSQLHEPEKPLWEGKVIPQPVNFNPRGCGPTRHARSIAQSSNWKSPSKWLELFVKECHWDNWTSETNAFAKLKESECQTTRGWTPGAKNAHVSFSSIYRIPQSPNRNSNVISGS